MTQTNDYSLLIYIYELFGFSTKYLYLRIFLRNGILLILQDVYDTLFFIVDLHAVCPYFCYNLTNETPSDAFIIPGLSTLNDTAHFSSFQILSYRLHYLMTHNNYLRLQGQLQPFTWHVGWILQRFFATFAQNFLKNSIMVKISGPLWINDIHFCKQASVFVQSHVRAHVELMWLLSSTTPIGWLNKMIQFKEKSRKAVRL